MNASCALRYSASILTAKSLFPFQTVVFDGGEFRALAGEFNQLRMIKDEQWDMMEQMIRSTNKKSKM